MMPHLKIKALLVEYFTWQPICHNRLYAALKVPRWACLPDVTPRAMGQCNQTPYNAHEFNLQCDILTMPKGRGFTAILR